MELTKEQIEYLTATIKNIPFFERCGIKEELELPFCSRQVENWQEAKINYTSIWWSNTTLEARNHLTEHLHNKYIEHDRHWNDYAKQLRSIVDRLIKDKICSYMVENHLRNSEMEESANNPNLWNCISWDIFCFAMEYIYMKQRPPTTFFTDLVEGVYMKGHFPCGWDMGLPETVFADEDYEIPWKGKYPAFGHLLYI